MVAPPWPMIDYWKFSIVNVSNFYFHVLFLSCFFQVVASPWSVMRFLGENFGYNLPSMPMIGETRWYISSYQICYTYISHKTKNQNKITFGVSENIFSGRVQSSAGERNTCIYTLQKKYTWPHNQLWLIGEPGKCYFRKWHFSHCQFGHFRCRKK